MHEKPMRLNGFWIISCGLMVHPPYNLQTCCEFFCILITGEEMCALFKKVRERWDAS